MFFRLHRCSFYYLRLFLFHFFYYFFNFYRLCPHYRFRHYYGLNYHWSRLYCSNRGYHHLFFLHLGFSLLGLLFYFGLNDGPFYNRYFLFLFRLFLHLFRFTTIQFIQINFSDRFKLRTCILRYDCLNHIFRLRFLRLLFEAFNRNRRLVTFLILTFLYETLRFKSKVLICTKLFYEYSVLLLANFCIRISLYGMPFLLQELNYRRDPYVQISCNFV